MRWVWGLTGLALLPLAWSFLCTAPGIYWNPPRIASAYALALGQPLYSLRDSGVHLGWFYGPVFPVWFLPVTLVRDVTALHLVAAVWNALTIVVPLALVLWVAGLRRKLGAMLVLACALLSGHKLLQGSWMYLHVDVVCLAFGTAACCAAVLWQQGRGTRWLHLAALALALALWTKQIAVALYPAFACWAWRQMGRQAAVQLAGVCVLHAALVSVAVFAWFGTEEVLFNVVLTHLRNPRDGGWLELGLRIVEFGQMLLPWLPVIGLVWWSRRAAPAAMPGFVVSLLALLGWAVLWQLPVGFKASIMAGGGLNSVHSLHYAMIVLLVVAGWQLAAAPAWPAGPRRILLLWVASMALLVGHGYHQARQGGTVWTVHRGQERLMAMAREQPGRCYFPWNPLIVLLAEGKLHPTDNALFLLWVMGLEPPAEKIRAAVPERPILVYEEPAQSKFALRYFPPATP
jgi:hypothetical protein